MDECDFAACTKIRLDSQLCCLLTAGLIQIRDGIINYPEKQFKMNMKENFQSSLLKEAMKKQRI